MGGPSAWYGKELRLYETALRQEWVLKEESWVWELRLLECDRAAAENHRSLLLTSYPTILSVWKPLLWKEVTIRQPCFWSRFCFPSVSMWAVNVEIYVLGTFFMMTRCWFWSGFLGIIVMMTKWWKALQSVRSKMVGPPRLLRSPRSAPFWKSISPNYYYCHFAIVIIISYSWIVSFFFIFHTYVKFTYCDYTKCETPSLLLVTQCDGWWPITDRFINVKCIKMLFFGISTHWYRTALGCFLWVEVMLRSLQR